MDGSALISEAIAMVQAHGFPEYVSFDHDLGGDRTGLDFAHYLIQLDLDKGTMPINFNFDVHSANPVGTENIEALLERYIRWKTEQEN